jgi:uncharacterized protein YjcR
MLTADAVRRIRVEIAGGYPAAALARRYGVSASAVRAAAIGQTWGHIVDPPPIPARRTGQLPNNAKLTAVMVRRARRAYTAGQSSAAIARELGVSEVTARRAIHGDTWVNVRSPAPVPPRLGGRGPVTMRPGMIIRAGRLRAEGMTYARIADDLGVSTSTVHRALSRRGKRGAA